MTTWLVSTAKGRIKLATDSNAFFNDITESMESKVTFSNVI